MQLVDRLTSKRPPQAKHDAGGLLNILNPPQIAKELRVSPDTVLGWINTKQLKAANVATGNRPRYKIRRYDLDRFLKLRSI